MFDHIVNWKLLKGSHDFPGPDGGTCVNEAAIIAAGFEYKQISSEHDCPKCFSRPIANYAIWLNDYMPNRLRNKLLVPFVMLLSGTSDTKQMEMKRARFLMIAGVQRISARLCERAKFHELALECRDVKTLCDCEEITQKIRQKVVGCAYSPSAAAAYAYAYAYDYESAGSAVAYAAASAPAARNEICTIACQILHEAILMGRHTDLDACEVGPRLEKAKRHLQLA